MLCQKEVHRKQGITRHQVHKDIENAQYGVSNYSHVLYTQGVILLRFLSGGLIDYKIHPCLSVEDVSSVIEECIAIGSYHKNSIGRLPGKKG